MIGRVRYRWDGHRETVTMLRSAEDHRDTMRKSYLPVCSWACMYAHDDNNDEAHGTAHSAFHALTLISHRDHSHHHISTHPHPLTHPTHLLLRLHGIT